VADKEKKGGREVFGKVRRKKEKKKKKKRGAVVDA